MGIDWRFLKFWKIVYLSSNTILLSVTGTECLPLCHTDVWYDWLKKLTFEKTRNFDERFGRSQLRRWRLLVFLPTSLGVSASCLLCFHVRLFSCFPVWYYCYISLTQTLSWFLFFLRNGEKFLKSFHVERFVVLFYCLNSTTLLLSSTWENDGTTHE